MNYARVGGRLVMVAIGAGAIGIAGAQFGHAISNNLALAHELAATNREILDLRAREMRDEREVERLSTAEGSIPEIHARLRQVGPREELMYVRYTKSGRPAASVASP